MNAPISPWAPPLRRLTAILVGLEVLWVAEGLVMGIVMPVAGAGLGGVAIYGWAFSGATLARLAAILGIGVWGGRLRPAVVLRGSLAIAALGSGTIGTAPSMEVLIGGRVLVGLGLGALAALTFQILALHYPQEVRERVILAFAVACVLPTVVLPLLAGWIADAAGWRTVVLAMAVVLGVGGPVSARMLGGLAPAGARAPAALRIREAGRLVGGALVILVGVGSTLPAAVAMVVMAAGVWMAGPPLVEAARRAGDVRRTGLALVVMGLGFFALFGLEPFVLLGLVAGRGQPAAAVALVIVPASAAWTAGAWANARWGVRLPRRTMMLAGLGGLAAGVVLMALPVISGLPAPVPVATLGRSVAAAGLGLVFSAGTVLAVEGASGGTSAMVMVRTVTTLGPALGAGVAGAIVGRGTGAGMSLSGALGWAGVLTLLVVLGASVVARGIRVQAPEERVGRLEGWWAGYRVAWIPRPVRRVLRVAASAGPPVEAPLGVPPAMVTRPPWLR